jgi:ABC-type glycerol-3-phosphate transport system permease component
MVGTSSMTRSTPSRTEEQSAPPRRRSGNAIRAWIISIVLLPISLVWIYPFLWMVSSSLKTNAEVFEGLGLFPDTLQLGNYIRAWNEAHIGQYFLNTVLVTAGSIVISVVSTAMIGYVLGRYKFPGRKIVAALLALAIFLPEGYTIIPVFDLINKLGLDDSLWGLTLAEAGGAHVIAILLFAGYFSQLPKELEEAAVIDGAGFVRIFWQVFLPLAKPVTATAIILQFMHSWNDFLLPLVLTLTEPELRTLSVGIYSFRNDFFTDWSGMAAASTISLVPIIVAFLFLQRYFVEGIAGAVKQ